MESKWPGSFKNLECPPDNINHYKSAKVVSGNIIPQAIADYVKWLDKVEIYLSEDDRQVVKLSYPTGRCMTSAFEVKYRPSSLPYPDTFLSSFDVY